MFYTLWDCIVEGFKIRPNLDVRLSVLPPFNWKYGRRSTESRQLSLQFIDMNDEILEFCGSIQFEISFLSQYHQYIRC